MNGNISTQSGSALIPTESTEYTNACNIYDLAGNVFEWTSEAYTSNSSRNYRDGSFYNKLNNDPAKYRYGSNPFSCFNNIGWRATLYINAKI